MYTLLACIVSLTIKKFHDSGYKSKAVKLAAILIHGGDVSFVSAVLISFVHAIATISVKASSTLVPSFALTSNSGIFISSANFYRKKININFVWAP